FNSVTSIQYTVSSRQNHPVHTTLKIYNTLGKEVRELVNTNRSTGSYSISWDGKNNAGKEVASGIYFYQLTTVNHKQTKRMIMLK
ncbi:MAG: FlgD immunoglobulin-like domain containing protein, partial [Candidatus Zixiibacteriota bacterium]